MQFFATAVVNKIERRDYLFRKVLLHTLFMRTCFKALPSNSTKLVCQIFLFCLFLFGICLSGLRCFTFGCNVLCAPEISLRRKLLSAPLFSSWHGPRHESQCQACLPFSLLSTSAQHGVTGSWRVRATHSARTPWAVSLGREYFLASQGETGQLIVVIATLRDVLLG